MKQLKQTAKFILLISFFSINSVIGQTSDQRKLELIFQGDVILSSDSPYAFSPNGKQMAVISNDKIVLFDIESGKVLRFFRVGDKTGYFTSVTISGDGKFLIGGFYDQKQYEGFVNFWNLVAGKEKENTRRIMFCGNMFRSGHRILSLETQSENEVLISTTCGIWKFNLDTNVLGRLAELPVDDADDPDYLIRANSSPNGKHWVAHTSRAIQGGGGWVWRRSIRNKKPSLSINNKGEFVFGDREGLIMVSNFVYDEKLDEGEYQIKDRFEKTYSSVFFNPQDDDELIITQPGILIKRNLSTNIESTVKLEGSAKAVSSISRDGKLVSNGVQIWDANTGKKIQDLSQVADKAGNFSNFGESVDLDSEDKLITGINEGKAIVWDLRSSSSPIRKTLDLKMEEEFSFEYEPVQLNDKKIIFRFEPFENGIFSSKICIDKGKGSENQEFVNCTSFWGNILLKYVNTEKKLLTVVSSSPRKLHIQVLKLDLKDSSLLIKKSITIDDLDVGYRNNDSPPINLEELKLDKTTILTGVKELISTDPQFVNALHNYLNQPITKDGKFEVRASNGRITIHDYKSGRLICSLIASGEDSWVVIAPDGHFDASDGALKLMHYTYGLEIINLEQLKEAYYEPGLLQKLTGYNKEPLRPIVPLENVKLYPEILEQKFDEKTERLTVKLRSRGGGIGRTEVYVAGVIVDQKGNRTTAEKLVVADARDRKLIDNPNVPDGEVVNLTVDLPPESFVKGSDNQIRVVTSNYLPEIKKGNIQSRGSVSVRTAKEKRVLKLPTLYAIVGGVSDYTGDELDLRFAAKDAEDFSSALQLGAKRLFGVEKVNITTLSTERKTLKEQPTKENFKSAIAEIAKKATAEDIFLIYLSGHGVTLGTGTDTYFYLTKDARSSKKSDLEKTFQTEAISNAELIDWLTPNKDNPSDIFIKALKQVVILDTCSAGNFAREDWKKDKDGLTGDQIRAMEFLKDKTGTFVMMGSAANAVSYEANNYNQGLLTLALLEGMKGLALQKATENIDVRLLFDYAEKRVPELATALSLNQRPIVKQPSCNTFVIGQMTANETKQIKIAQSKPMLLRPLLTNPETGDDDLKLIPALRKMLDAESSYEVIRQRGGGEPILVYIDDDSFPNAIRLTGTYTSQGGNIRIKAFLRRDNKTIATLPEITAERKEMALEKLLELVQRELNSSTSNY